MSARLARRLQRLQSSGPSRVRVITMPWTLAKDRKAIERAKAAQGITTGPNDLLVIVRKFTEAQA